MPEFIVREMCQVGGEIRREGSVLTMSKNDVKKEISLGKHPKNGKWLSAILNHCEPADDDTYALIFGKPDGKMSCDHCNLTYMYAMPDSVPVNVGISDARLLSTA